MNNFLEQLEKLHNEDETNRLETKLKSIESIAEMSRPNGKDLIRDDMNKLAKEIEDSVEQEKKYS